MPKSSAKPNFNVDYTAKLQFIVQSWIVEVLSMFSFFSLTLLVI